ncbi:MAG: biopolymer transport protein ExbD [Candidatus Sumerlaeota bacterium]|nr:biopolymer transport protein ExbD [Candidatus Sumerlaeota bacterium]
MARRRAISKRMTGLGTSLNLTPLLDIIFNLIFFFLLATSIREKPQYLEVTLPSAATGETRTVDKTVPVITLAADGRTLLDGTAVDDIDLRNRLIRLVQEDKVAEAVVESDAGIAVQRFFTAADICRQAGIPTVTPRVEPRRDE